MEKRPYNLGAGVNAKSEKGSIRMTSTKAPTKEIKKLSLKKVIVKDLAVKGRKSGDIRGGASGSGLHGSVARNASTSV